MGCGACQRGSTQAMGNPVLVGNLCYLCSASNNKEDSFICASKNISEHGQDTMPSA